MDKTVLYVHGKGGNSAEAQHYEPLFDGAAVVGLDYRSATPWEAAEEFPVLFDAACGGCRQVTLIANSIGAYFAMSALAEKPIDRAFLISPVVDMERLILDMLSLSGAGEDELRRLGEIETSLGETLSWNYLSYVRTHPIRWRVRTHILCGERDQLTSRETFAAFAERTGATLTVMDGGEHWFHTAEEMRFLDAWIRSFQEK